MIDGCDGELRPCPIHHACIDAHKDVLRHIVRFLVDVHVTSLATPVHELLPYELRLLPLRCVLLDEIWEEEEFEDDKHDEKLDKDDRPERAPQCHVLEAVVIQIEDFVYEPCLSHIFQEKKRALQLLAKNKKKNPIL